MSNLAARVFGEDAWPGLREQACAACQAPSRAIARDLAADTARTRKNEFPSAVANFEACIAHLRMPARHRKAIRTANPPERLFGEERRCLTAVPNALGEKPVLKQMFAAMTRASSGGRRSGSSSSAMRA